MPLPQTLPLKRALVLSTALHLLFAPFLIASTTFALGEAMSREMGAAEITHVSYLRIERPVPARPRALAARAVSSVVRTVEPAPEARQAVRPATMLHRHAPISPVLPAKRPSSATEIGGRTHFQIEQRGALRASRAAAPDPEPQAVAQHVAAPAAEPGSLNKTDVDPALETPAPPVATPTPAKVIETTTHGIDVPSGGWGQSFDKPLVADEAALADLRTHYHAASAITVEVDEAGHATRISLPAGLPDDVRAELEKRLRELRYVPAECNGLRCGGTLQVLI